MHVDWANVYRSEAESVLNFFLFRVGNRADAEDLSARTFELAWKRRRSYDYRRGEMKAWIIGIARNVLVDGRRHDRLDSLDAELSEFEDTIHSSPMDLAIQECAKEAVLHAVRDLPKRQQEIVAMKFGAGMTNRDIAAVLGMTESNVGTVLFRALRELKARLIMEEWNVVR